MKEQIDNLASLTDKVISSSKWDRGRIVIEFKDNTFIMFGVFLTNNIPKLGIIKAKKVYESEREEMDEYLRLKAKFEKE